MKIEIVEYGYTWNRGNYESEKLSVSARVEEGEVATAVIETLKKIVHGEALAVVEPKKEEPKPQEAEKLKEPEAEAPVSEEKPQAEKKKQVETKATKKKLNAAKMTTYSRENQGHKNMVGELLSKTFPDWKKTPQRAKDVSAQMEGTDFLDEEGLILQSFKEKFKEAYANWKP